LNPSSTNEDMRTAFSKLFRHRFQYFHLNADSSYKTFITDHILSDYYHPFHARQKQKLASRDRSGLWWHVTVNSRSSSTRVVRSWLRRRLRNAFLESLKEKGVDEDGKLICDERVYRHTGVLGEKLAQGQKLELKGSVNLQALKPLVTAKFADVRKETDTLVQRLLDGLRDEMRNVQGQHAAEKSSHAKSARGIVATESKKQRATSRGT
jgi:hypothetical protein